MLMNYAHHNIAVGKRAQSDEYAGGRGNNGCGSHPGPRRNAGELALRFSAENKWWVRVE